MTAAYDREVFEWTYFKVGQGASLTILYSAVV